ncbi:MAG: class E sortase [Actinomycetota bacterium]|nr:class E sortase [Actinomycetota bacterium]
MGHLRGAFRAVLRFVASVLMVSGALLVLDATATLVWQEPISAVIASTGQSALEGQLSELPSGGDDLAAGASALARRAERGRAVGRITMPTLGRSYVIVQGVGTSALRKGPGHYSGTAFPGQGQTVAIAGHRTTYMAPFRTVNRLRRTQPVVLEMPYGRLTYRVEKTRIVPPTATEVTRDVGYDRLVLTACHPLYSAAERIVVFARLERAEPR